MTHEEFCPNCEEYHATKVVEQEQTYTVRSRAISVRVRTELCSKCGQSLGSDESDQETLDLVYSEYRKQEDLLTPERIKEIRKRYRLSQRSIAVLLGMSEATINRYEKGGLQDQPHDAAIRACEEPGFVRGLLERRGHLLSEWQRKRAKNALDGKTEREGIWLDQIGQGGWVQAADEVSDRTGYRRFDPVRFASVVVWFCERLGGVFKTPINKLLFYADFLNFKTTTVSLTGTAYRKAPLGFVPTDYGKLLGWMEDEQVLVCQEVEFPNGHTGYRYRPGPKADLVKLDVSQHEAKVLQCVADQLGSLSAKDISDRSHQETAWNTTESGAIVSYQAARDLSLSLAE